MKYLLFLLFISHQVFASIEGSVNINKNATKAILKLTEIVDGTRHELLDFYNNLKLSEFKNYKIDGIELMKKSFSLSNNSLKIVCDKILKSKIIKKIECTFLINKILNDPEVSIAILNESDYKIGAMAMTKNYSSELYSIFNNTEEENFNFSPELSEGVNLEFNVINRGISNISFGEGTFKNE